MRDYAKIIPTFWTRGTGKALRGDAPAQLLALYLFTAPGSTMLGLFYCPLETMALETGLSIEGASKALRRLSEGGLAPFDPLDDLVWLPAGLRISVGRSLALNDNRCKGISKDLESFGNHRFASALLHVYGATHHLKVEGLEASPFEAPSKPLRSQDQDQEQEQEQEQEPSRGGERKRSAGKPEAKRVRREPEAEPSGYAALVATYFEAFEAARGCKPPFQARDGKAAKALLLAFGGSATLACEAVRAAYAPGAWTRDKATLASIAADPAKCLGQGSLGASRSTLQHAVAGEAPGWVSAPEILV